MPKIVNHTERREELLAATWSVMRQVPFSDVTIKAIAKEAGCSTGVLAHYFKNKRDIILSSHELAFERLRMRVNELLKQNLDSFEKLKTIVDWMLPVDDARLLDAIVEVSFWGAAVGRPAMLEVRMRSANIMLTGWFLPLVRDLRARNCVRGGGDDQVLTKAIMVFIDGVSAYAVLFPDLMDFKEVERQRQAFLDQNFCPQPSARSGQHSWPGSTDGSYAL